MQQTNGGNSRLVDITEEAKALIKDELLLLAHNNKRKILEKANKRMKTKVHSNSFWDSMFMEVMLGKDE